MVMERFMTEPIAYINIEERKLEWATPIKWETPTVVNMDKVPLYTAPPLQLEPVAYLCENAVGHKYFRWRKPQSVFKPIALFSALPQREWVGMTNDEYEAMAEQYVTNCYFDTLKYAHAIEQSLREKNRD